MYVLAITGGIGSGKTVASEFFRSRGAVVFDLDRLAKDQLEPGKQCYSKVVQEFGESVLDELGRIDRRALADIAFSTPEANEALGDIVHPAVVREIGMGLTDLRLLPFPPALIVIDVPLLVEVPVFAEFADHVLSIAAPAHVRRARWVAAGLDAADFDRRLVLQASDEDREVMSDTVIHNIGTYDEYLDTLERFWARVVEPNAA